MSSVSVRFQEDTSTVAAVWQVRNFTTVTAPINSEPFCPPGHDDMRWVLGMTFPDGTVQISLLSNYVADVTAEVRSGFLGPNNNTLTFEHVEPSRQYPSKFTSSRAIKIRPVMQRQDVQNLCSTNGVLRIAVRIRCFDTLAFHPVVSNKFKVADHMVKAFREEQFTDVTFKADDREIRAHRVVISSCDVFKAMLLSSSREANFGRIVIEDIRYPILRALIEFLYAGEYNLTTVPFAARLLMAADKYNLMALREICEKYIVTNVTRLTVIDALIITEPLELVAVNNKALKIISETPYEDVIDMHLINGNVNLQKLVHNEMVKTIKSLKSKIASSG